MNGLPFSVRYPQSSVAGEDKIGRHSDVQIGDAVADDDRLLASVKPHDPGFGHQFSGAFKIRMNSEKISLGSRLRRRT